MNHALYCYFHSINTTFNLRCWFKRNGT